MSHSIDAMSTKISYRIVWRFPFPSGKMNTALPRIQIQILQLTFVRHGEPDFIATPILCRIEIVAPDPFEFIGFNAWRTTIRMRKIGM